MNKLFVFFFLFPIVTINAQGIINKNNASTSINTNLQQLNYISLQSSLSPLPSDSNVVNTGIFIQQIGNNNYSEITTQSTVNDVQLNQFGNNNNIDLKLKAEIIDYSVTQNGNNNTLIEYNTFNSKQLLERTVEQNGNGQNLVIEGSNSIVDKMRITMDNGSQSLIIRNVN
jgi:hypothetical protein